ncbi:MAG: hypothetical protein WC917_01810 [Bacilli bacterium]|jgi:hypothetical protein
MKRIKELLENKYIKAGAFFGFYLLFFGFFFLLSVSKPETKPIEKIEKHWTDIKKIYEYEAVIKNLQTEETITITGKRFFNKNLFTKGKDKVYYFYGEIYLENEDGKFEKVDEYEMVSEKFNDEYLDISIIKEKLTEDKQKDKVINFDESETIKYVVDTEEYYITSNNDVLKELKIITKDYLINIKYKNIDNVEDFVVEK